jgi:hypothetical protein
LQKHQPAIRRQRRSCETAVERQLLHFREIALLTPCCQENLPAIFAPATEIHLPLADSDPRVSFILGGVNVGRQSSYGSSLKWLVQSQSPREVDVEAPPTPFGGEKEKLPRAISHSYGADVIRFAVDLDNWLRFLEWTSQGRACRLVNVPISLVVPSAEKESQAFLPHAGIAFIRIAVEPFHVDNFERGWFLFLLLRCVAYNEGQCG